VNFTVRTDQCETAIYGKDCLTPVYTPARNDCQSGYVVGRTARPLYGVKCIRFHRYASVKTLANSTCGER